MLPFCQDGKNRSSTPQVLAVASLSVPLGAATTLGVCYLALRWRGSITAGVHTTAIAMQGAIDADKPIASPRADVLL